MTGKAVFSEVCNINKQVVTLDPLTRSCRNNKQLVVLDFPLTYIQKRPRCIFIS